jgi:hypothetical protein
MQLVGSPTFLSDGNLTANSIVGDILVSAMQAVLQRDQVLPFRISLDNGLQQYGLLLR